MKKILFYITLSFCVLFNYTFAENIEETKIITENNNNNNNNNNNKPLVSVIMPVYNAEEFLDRSISSVINQTYDNLEILLIDDCSTDNSYNILKEYAKKDKRIKIFHNQENQHVSETRNVGIRNSTGKYLYFIDSDDFIDNDYIEHLVNTAEKENADVVVNPNIYQYKNGRKKLNILTETFNKEKDNKNYNIIAIKVFPSVYNRLYKKDIQEKYDIFFPKGVKFIEDTYFNVLFFASSNNIIFIQPKSYYYRNITANSITRTLNRTSSLNDLFYVANKQYKFLKNNNLLNNNYFMNLKVFEDVLFNTKIYIENEENIKEIKREYYTKIRQFLLSIKGDLLNNNLLYYNDEKNILLNFEKYKTYDEYEKYYNARELKKDVLALFMMIILSILILYTLYIFYKIYKDFRKGINPFKNNIFNKINKNE